MTAVAFSSSQTAMNLGSSRDFRISKASGTSHTPQSVSLIVMP